MTFNPRFGRPLPASVKIKVSSGWGRPRPDNRRHPGLDIPIPEGTPILAMADGVAARVVPTATGDAGIWVGVRHGDGLWSRYMHMSRVAVSPNALVGKGQVIGYSGNTGLSSGPHLHVDLKIDPAKVGAVRFAAGEPEGGFLPEQAPYGVGIPAEPWIPLRRDELSERTIAEAKANGIPLWVDRSIWNAISATPGAFTVGLGAGVGAILLSLRTWR